MAGYLNAVCPPGHEQSGCRQAFAASQNFVVLAKATSGPKGQADVARYVAKDSASRPTIPTSLVNFGEAVNFPLILGLCTGGVRRGDAPPSARGQRRPAPPRDGTPQGARLRERAGRRHRALASHDGCPGGIVIGIPLGIVVGRVVWNGFATNLGAVPVAAVPG